MRRELPPICEDGRHSRLNFRRTELQKSVPGSASEGADQTLSDIGRKGGIGIDSWIKKQTSMRRENRRGQYRLQSDQTVYGTFRRLAQLSPDIPALVSVHLKCYEGVPI